MGLPGLLRGPRRWTLLIAVSIIAITIHALSSLFPGSPYSYHQPTLNDYQSKQGSVDISTALPPDDSRIYSVPDVAQDPAFLSGIPESSESESSGSRTVPDQVSLPEPSPSGADLKPHEFTKADDFLSHFASLSNIENLTVDGAIGGCDWSPDELEQFGYSTNQAWVRNHIATATIETERGNWQAFVAKDMISSSRMSPSTSETGIVVVAGHPMAMKRFLVLVRALRDLGSKLPIELAYWGPEVNETTRDAVTSEFPTMTLYFTDLSSSELAYHSPRQYTADIHINFQLKLSALLNCRFAKPLLLDSDNFPVRDPISLWQSPTFLKYGTVFYPDIARMRPENPLFAITNTPCERNVYEFESGQLLVDKEQFWYHLQLADWFIGQEWYKTFLLGDKDTFRFAWNALKTEYGRPKKWLTLVGLSLLQPSTPLNTGLDLPTEIGRDGKEVVREFCGHSFAQSHPDTGEVYFLHGGTLKSFSAPLLAMRQKQKSGVFVEFKRSAVDEKWSEIEHDVRLKYMSSGVAYREAGHEIGDVLVGDDASSGGMMLTDKDLASTVMCSDMMHVAARPVTEIGLGGVEGAFNRAGGYWMIGEEYRAGSSGA